jgi:hypothetical protein
VCPASPQKKFSQKKLNKFKIKKMFFIKFLNFIIPGFEFKLKEFEVENSCRLQY